MTGADASPPGRARLDAIEPQRRCVACRRPGARSVLLRFAVAEVDGEPTVVHDPRRALPGRGAWLHPDPDCWTLAQRRSALTRALRTGARIDQAGIDAVFAASQPEHDAPHRPAVTVTVGGDDITGSGSER